MANTIDSNWNRTYVDQKCSQPSLVSDVRGRPSGVLFIYGDRYNHNHFTESPGLQANWFKFLSKCLHLYIGKNTAYVLVHMHTLHMYVHQNWHAQYYTFIPYSSIGKYKKPKKPTRTNWTHLLRCKYLNEIIVLNKEYCTIEKIIHIIDVYIWRKSRSLAFFPYVQKINFVVSLTFLCFSENKI